MTACMPAVPRVAVVLVNWNGWTDCVECLDALWAIDYPAFDVFLVDNDSHDGSVERIVEWCSAPHSEPDWKSLEHVRRHSSRGGEAIGYQVHDGPPIAPVGSNDGPPRLHLVRSGGNMGFAGGNNIGMRAAGVDDYAYYWLLNTDTVVDHRALSRLVERAESDPRVGTVGSTLRYYRNPELVQAMGGAKMDPATASFSCIGIGQPASAVPIEPGTVEREMVYVVGASMLVSSAFVREVGYMQEDYFLYFEEPDWAWRGRQRFKLGYAPASLVYHKVGASSAEVASLSSLNLLYRNRIRFVARFMPQSMGRAKRDIRRHLLGLVRRGRFREALVVARVLLDSHRLRLSVAPGAHP